MWGGLGGSGFERGKHADTSRADVLRSGGRSVPTQPQTCIVFLPCRCVIHYQIPASVDVYVHRSGRTARAEAEGLAVALVTPKESARFAALLRALNRPLPPEFPLVRRGC